MRVLIIGCGYVGLPLGAELVRRGYEVFGVRRTADSAHELEQAGIKPLVADITRRDDLEKIRGPFDWVVNTVSSTRGGVEEYRAVYLEGTQHLIEWLSRQPPRKYIYTSSTSVYAQADGSWVSEESAAEGASDTSRVLVETERLLLQAARKENFPAVLLRVAGIYGPHRGHLFQQYLRDEARISGDGSRLINMIHLDDIVQAIIAALERGKPGEIYNVADDEPVMQRDFFHWLSQQGRAGCPQPAASAPGSSRRGGDTAPYPAIPRKRGDTNKRVSNRKLRLELLCELKYPTFRQGYSAEIARLQAAGQLPAKFGVN